jgi:hypothetical protein
MTDQTDVREFLQRMANEADFAPVEPGPVVRKARRRLARTVGGMLLTAGALVAGALVAANGLTNADRTRMPQPAGQPTPTRTTTGETTGTWTGPCLDSQDGPPPWVCLGPLDEGTYTSQRFEPALTFTVPAGWNNPWDTRGAFDLWSPGWSDGWDDPNDPGVYMFSHPGLHVRRDPRPEGGCVDATVGTSAIELTTWVANHPAIAAGAPSPVEVGGLTGYQLDVSLADTWRESCPGGPAAVWLFEDLYLRDPNKYPEFATMRLILLDLPDGGSVLIAIDEDRLDVAMPVVDSFVFDLG